MTDLVQLNSSVFGLTQSIDKLVSTLQKQEKALLNLSKAGDEFGKSVSKTTSKVNELERAQKLLGVAVEEDGKFFNEAGLKVNKYGQLLSVAGQELGNFNKRSQLMNSTINSFAKEGRAVPFLEGLARYSKEGGNAAEYLAEFLSSAREELTVFGIEAAKARKVMYGFLPSGMFRIVNKLSSSLQFFGGIYRKTFVDTSAASRKEIAKLEKRLKSFTKDSEGYNLILGRIKAEQESLAEGDFASSLSIVFKGPINKAKELRDALSEGFTNPIDKSFIGFTNALVSNMGKLVKNTGKLGYRKFPFRKLIKDIKSATEEFKKFSKGYEDETAVKNIEVFKKSITKLNAELVDVKKAEDYLKAFSSPLEDSIDRADELRKKLLDAFEANKRESSSATATGKGRVSEDAIKLMAKQLTQLDATNKKREEANAILERKALLEKKLGKQMAFMNSLEPNVKGIEVLSKEVKLLEKNTKQREKALNIRRKEIKAMMDEAKRQRKIAEDSDARLKALPKGSSARASLTKVRNEALDKATDLEGRARAKGKGIGAESKKLRADKTLLSNSKEQLKLSKKARMDSFTNVLRKNKKIDMVFKVFKFMKTGLLPLIKFALLNVLPYIIVGALAVVAIIKIVRVLYPFMKDAFKEAKAKFDEGAGMLGKLKESFGKGFDKVKKGFTDIFGFIFGNKTLVEFIDGIVLVAVGLGQMLVTAIGVYLIVAFAFTKSFIGGLWSALKERVKGAEDKVGQIIKIVLGVALVIAGITAAIMGAPVLVVVAVGLIIYRVYKMFEDKVIGFFKALLNIGVFIGNITILLVQASIKIANIILNTRAKILNELGKVFRPLGRDRKTDRDTDFSTFNTVDYFAKGGVSKGGMAVVGEQGAELVNLPKGSRVYNKNDTKRLLQNSNQTVNNFNITVNAKDTSKQEMRKMADEIGRMVSSKINRSTSSSTFR